MHIFRWLMTHPIITAWILAALAVLLNLNMGTNEHEGGKHAENEVTHEVVESGKATVDEASDSPSSLHSEVTASENTSQLTNTKASGVEGNDRQTANVTDHENQVAPAIKEQAPLDSSSTQGAISSAPIDGQTDNNKSTENETSIEGLESLSSQNLLQLAREAFWENKKEKSVAIYQALIKREPDSLVHKGELANVYWHQNKQKESAALYAEISVPMIEEGKVSEVSNMIGFISVFFPEKALELQQLMPK